MNDFSVFNWQFLFLGTSSSFRTVCEHNSQLISYDGAQFQDVDKIQHMASNRLV